MTLVIVSTMPNRSVAVTVPTPELLAEMRLGIVAARSMRGHDQRPLDRDWEAAKQLRDDWRRDLTDAHRREVAHAWFEALNVGGLSERDTLELMRWRSTPSGSFAPEIVDTSELPDERVFDAWRRSLNGGPIVIDQDAAARINAERAVRMEMEAVRKAAFERRVRRRLTQR